MSINSTGSILLRRGPTTDRELFCPLDGEIIYDSTLKKVYVGDGQTYGGIPVGSNISYIDQLIDVNTSSTPPSNGQALIWDGSSNAWIPQSLSGAGVYVLPTASTTTLGGVKVDGTTITITNGVISSSPSLFSGVLQSYKETVISATISTSTYNIDLSTANIFDFTVSSNVAFTFTNPPSSGVLFSATVILRQDSVGNRLVNFINAKYSDGITPILSTSANNIDVLTFFTVNGGAFWFGTFAMANVS